MIATHKEMRQMAFDLIPRKSFIIEIGCSTGNFAELIRNTDHRYIGIDIQEDKINEARKNYPELDFITFDISKNLNILRQASVVVSFQCLEHIREDLNVISAISSGTMIILSVPNRKYKGHFRWYELEGWKNRYSPYIEFLDIITIQHPKKPNNRSFLFNGVRNGKNY